MDAMILKILRMALAAFSRRILAFLSLVMTFALSWYVMWQPDWIRFAAAVFFGSVICFPVMMREHNPEKDETT